MVRLLVVHSWAVVSFQESSCLPSGSFREFGVPYLGVVIIRILLFRVLIRVSYFWKLPNPAQGRIQGLDSGT